MKIISAILSAPRAQGPRFTSSNQRRRLSFIKPLAALLGCLVATTVFADLPASDPAWPFDRPSIDTLRGSQKKVFAHYFTQFPLAISNVHWLTPDYYNREYLSAYGEDAPAPGDPLGPHRHYGGFLRQRPIPTPVVTGSDASDFELANLKKEILTAIRLGIDGFTLDLLGYGTSGAAGTHWTRAQKMMQAAVAVDPDSAGHTGFKIVIMPDISTSSFAPVSGAANPNLTAAVNVLRASPAAYRVGGRLVVAPYRADAMSASAWQTWITNFNSTTGENIYFIPVFLQATSALRTAFAPFSNGMSDWGERHTPYLNPPAAGAPGSGGTSSSTYTDFSNVVHGLTNSAGQTLISMVPVSPQDHRPKEQIRYKEANGSMNLRQSWFNAIRNDVAAGSPYKGDWVQIVTWNDYSEHAEIAPSTGTQYAYYDLCAYYTAWFKTGVQPAITRDTIFYFHRKQHTTAPWDVSYQDFTPTHGQTGGTGAPWRDGSTTPTDYVEMVAFVQPIAGSNSVTLEINLNGTLTTQTYTATNITGIFTLRAPIPSATSTRVTPSMRLLRGTTVAQSVTSNFEINNTIVWSDYLYRGGSSRRDPVEGSYYARVNFGVNPPTWTAATWMSDWGDAYGAKTGLPATFLYGWLDGSGNPVSNTANVRNRNYTGTPTPPDERYDTLVKTLNPTTHDWRISLPQGQYKVRLVGGDPTSLSGLAYKLAVNGSTFINGTTTNTVKWFDTAGNVIIPLGTTGVLTITTPSGASVSDNAVNFIEITPY